MQKQQSFRPSTLLAILALLITSWSLACGSPATDNNKTDNYATDDNATDNNATDNNAVDGNDGDVETLSSEGPIFEDRTLESGLDFVHFNGMVGEFYYAEMMGAGVALFDADQDGDLDLYLVQGEVLQPAEEALQPPPPNLRPLVGRLYRNELESGTLRFRDITEESAINARGYGMGVAVGDVDRNGFPDLVLTYLDGAELWLNQDGKMFRQSPLPTDRRWFASASLVDFDADGWLDLYLTAYVDFDVASHKLCRTLTGAPDYCGPLAYKPQADRLLHHLGLDEAGSPIFRDISKRSGIGDQAAAGLGVVSGDFNADGRVDVYVANDGMANFLWLQNTDGTFDEMALLTGTALSGEGQAEAGMGVVAADFDSDGDEDLFLTHLALETNTLYRNESDGFFIDHSLPSGLGSPSWTATAFGTVALDFDNDGWLDLMTVSGGVRVIPELVAQDDPHPIHMPNQLFHNLGEGRFEDVSQRAGEVFSLSEVSRGLAVGDLDNDGDPDVVISQNSGPARLLVNQIGQKKHWLGLDLRDPQQQIVLGARVVVELDDGRRLSRWVRTDGSYLSASDPRLLFGLGAARVRSIKVFGPEGRQRTFQTTGDPTATGRYHSLIVGTLSTAAEPG